ncbi:hypothetical protein NYG90_04175 [Helicobacter sp. XJK30-2]|uniref:Uncharacterized protein n=1 Tax=Helicobacter zhangjianzhongii TaxID=2974574 RepID=A0ACC6FSI8_9HELI|nr:hypothetical protein [Helicobacter sp. XJK30-2]MDL0081878.1 hypothetical protein [Helicobacter sp. XJK30-2]
MTKVESACWCRFCAFLESTFSRISTQILESTFETFAAFFCHREPCATLPPLSSRASATSVAIHKNTAQSQILKSTFLLYVIMIYCKAFFFFFV